MIRAVYYHEVKVVLWMVILTRTAAYIATFIWNGGSLQQKRIKKYLSQKETVSFILLVASGLFNKNLGTAAEWPGVCIQDENDNFAWCSVNMTSACCIKFF